MRPLQESLRDDASAPADASSGATTWLRGAPTTVAAPRRAGRGGAGVVGRHGDAWKVRVAAPPERGRANDAVLDLLAETLAVPRASVTLVSGGGAGQDRRADRDRPDESSAARLGGRTGDPPDEHRHRRVPGELEESRRLQQDDRAPRHGTASLEDEAGESPASADNHLADTATETSTASSTTRSRRTPSSRCARSTRRSRGSRTAPTARCDVCGKPIPVERLEALP